MKSIRYVHWQDGDMWIGYLDEYPDYLTQGESLQEPGAQQPCEQMGWHQK